MLKQNQNQNTEVCRNQGLSAPELEDPSAIPTNLTLNNSFIGYSKVRKGHRLKSESIRHNPILSPASIDEWVKDSPGELTSKWRKEFHTYLEVSLDVKSYQMRPVSIPFYDRNGKKCEYKPLFLLNYWTDDSAPRNRKNLLADIWSDSEIRANADWLIPAWKAAHRFSQYKRLDFRIFRDSFFLSNYFYNVQFIREYYLLEPDEEYWNLINFVLEKYKSINLSQILNENSKTEEQYKLLLTNIWTLVSMGCIKANWNERFSLDTKLSSCE